MDALEDTHHAISAFVATASKLEPKYQTRELGERYLRTYGVMQAFVVQQDAALNLHVSLGNARARLEAPRPHPGLESRGSWAPHTAGPAQETSTTGSLHSQMTLGDGGMELLTVDGSGQPVFRHVPIPRLAAEQEKYILSLIRQALARLT
jgi:hypothetical protein